jgi:O-antigen/teichoic acid export membrane protein
VAITVLAMFRWTWLGMTVATPVYRPRLWLRTSLPMLFAALTWMLLQRIDIVMLAMLADFHDTGTYVVATRLANLVSIGLILVGGIVAPLIAEFYAGGRTEDLQRLVAQAAAGCTILGGLATLAMLFAGEFLLGLFGAEYEAAYPALVILSVGHLLLAVFGSAQALATMTAYEDLRAIIGTATVGLNVLLNLLLIPPYGINGAAFATSISLLISSLMLYWLARRKLDIDATALGLWRLRRAEKEKGIATPDGDG